MPVCQARQSGLVAILLLFGLAGRAICGTIMAVGPKFMTEQTTLVVHAIGATMAFAAPSAIYFRRFAFTEPAANGAIFFGLVVVLDVFLVAPVFIGSFDTFLTGWLMTSQGTEARA